MAVPARPVAGNPIAPDWGGLVHDEVVALHIQHGKTQLVWSNNALSNEPTTTFPVPFADTPIVVAVVATEAGTAAQPRLSLALGQVSPTGFTARGVETRETAVTATVFVEWIAIGTRA